jgi:hypothetical protein
MLRRGAAVSASMAALMLVGTGLAWAGDDGWGAVDCGQAPNAGCELRVGQIPQPAGDRGSSPRPVIRARVPDDTSTQCSYTRVEEQPPPAGAAPRPSGVAGGWYVYGCPAALYAIWIPDGGRSGAAPVSPAQLAMVASRQLRLPAPRIRSNPAGPQLVNLPTWLWVEGSDWGLRSATVSVPGASVTATATPTRVVWSMGDGGEVTCVSAGTPFPPGADPTRTSPDCGYTYRFASQGRPRNAFPVVATVWWSVEWSGAGQHGRFEGLRTSSAAEFAVVESQSVASR